MPEWPDLDVDVYALKVSDRPEAIGLLLPLLAHPGVHARVHAAEGLVQKLGLTALAEPRGSPLRRMMLAQCSNLPTLWPLGGVELHEALLAVHAGSSPESLDLVHRESADPMAVARFWEQATQRMPFDVPNIVAMSEHDRAWAETVLLARLTNGDVQALRAISALNVRRWPTHVRAAMPLVETLIGAPGELQAIIEAYGDALSSVADVVDLG